MLTRIFDLRPNWLRPSTRSKRARLPTGARAGRVKSSSGGRRSVVSAESMVTIAVSLLTQVTTCRVAEPTPSCAKERCPCPGHWRQWPTVPPRTARTEELPSATCRAGRSTAQRPRCRSSETQVSRPPERTAATSTAGASASAYQPRRTWTTLPVDRAWSRVARRTPAAARARDGALPPAAARGARTSVTRTRIGDRRRPRRLHRCHQWTTRGARRCGGVVPRAARRGGLRWKA